MNDNMKKWVAALRSDKYEQGSGCLRSRREKYCCLGVACDVYRCETGNGEWIKESDGDVSYSFIVGGDIAGGYLSQTVANWLGVWAVNPFLQFPEGSISASFANDNRRSSFGAIADAVERTYGEQQ